MPHEYLSSINEVLASIGAQLYHLRSQLVTSLIPYIQDYYHELSLGREEVSIRYIPSWERAEANPEEYQENAWVESSYCSRITFTENGKRLPERA